jgi:hypothetical protein
MIHLPMTAERYQEILTALDEPHLKLKLSPHPTTMGAGYVAEMIAKILSAKSFVNDLAEEVERAYTRTQVLHNDLTTELELRTEIITFLLTDKDIERLDAAGRRALIRERVDKTYVKDQTEALLHDQANGNRMGEPLPGPYELWEDIRQIQNMEIELKALLRMLDRRREELSKMDSGIRLQQRTIDIEISIYRNSASQHVNGKTKEFSPVLGDASCEPDVLTGTYSDEVPEDHSDLVS